MSNRLRSLKKRTTGIGAGAEQDRQITVSAAEWNAIVDNFDYLEKRNDILEKQVAELQKLVKRLGK